MAMGMGWQMSEQIASGVAEARDAAHAIRGHLDTNGALLASILERLSNDQTIAVSDSKAPIGPLDHFPSPDARRYALRRPSTGGQKALSAGVITDIVEANYHRLGGTIVNRGAVPVTLFLANAARASGEGGVGQLYLVQNGGSWDFRLGNLLWAGSVAAIAEAGASTLAIVTV